MSTELLIPFLSFLFSVVFRAFITIVFRTFTEINLSVKSEMERQWDAYVGPKKSSLFTVKVTKGSDGKFKIGSDFKAPLRGTGHVCIILRERRWH